MWALDYQFDQTTDGRTLKLLNVVDEHTREALTIAVDRRIDADATVAVLGPPGRRAWPATAVHPLRQRSRAHGQRPARLVPVH